MPPLPESPRWRRTASFATVVIVVATLYLAQDLLLPFAVAALLTFLLAPVVSLLQRLRLPRIVAVVVAVFVAIGGVGALGATLVVQLDDLAESLPQYRDTIRAKLASLGGVVADLERNLGEGMQSTAPPPPAADAPIEKKIDKPPADTTPTALSALLPKDAKGPTGAEPMRVIVVPPPPSTFAVMTDIAGPLLGPLGTLAIISVLVLFMLVNLEDLRDRGMRILGGRDVTLTTQAVSELSGRISRYLLMTLIVNATYGIPVGIGLFFLGIPNAFLWGLLAILLRFIPYLGPWIAAAMPVALSIAIAPGWELTLGVVTLFLVLELVSNNIVEPWLYGSRTGLSPLAIVVAAVFWTWLWGTMGLLLSVPLTLILVVSGRYIPQLRVLYTLFGDGPRLATEARFYQRLVAGDADQAAHVAMEFLDRRPLPALFDEVILPALRALKHDESTGLLAPEQVDSMRESFAELAADLPKLADKRARRRDKAALAEQEEAGEAEGLGRVEAAAAFHADASDAGPAPSEAAVVFVPAGDATDALVGPLLAELLRAEGIAVKTMALTTLSHDLVRSSMIGSPDVVVVAGFAQGGVPSGGFARLRHLVALAAEHAPATTRIVAGLWDRPAPVEVESVVARPKSRASVRPVAVRATLLEELAASERAGVDAVVLETLIDMGAHEVVHALDEAVAAVRRTLLHRSMGVAA